MKFDSTQEKIIIHLSSTYCLTNVRPETRSVSVILQYSSKGWAKIHVVKKSIKVVNRRLKDFINTLEECAVLQAHIKGEKPNNPPQINSTDLIVAVQNAISQIWCETAALYRAKFQEQDPAQLELFK